VKLAELIVEGKPGEWTYELAKKKREAKADKKYLDKRITDYFKAAKPAKVKKPTDDEIMMKIDDAIGQTFPDTEPIGYLLPWMSKHGLDYKDIDRVVNKQQKRKTGLDGYLADIWRDNAGDRILDAERGHIDKYSPFYVIDENGKIHPTQNPWK
jgi:hypothetical protein